MFTGIVAAEGRVVETTPRGDGLRLIVATGDLGVDDVAIGDSIAVNGCCLTAVECARPVGHLAFDVSAETLRCTAGLEAGAAVNLEKALRLADRLGGHLMSGHVDGVGTVHRFTLVAPSTGGARDATASMSLVIEVPDELGRFIAVKGSIAVAGVSLTVNTVDGPAFGVNLIPHTLQSTTLRHLHPGARVNLEVDLIARYLARLAERD
ncbi:MAG: riboflavin synthase [Casimicrobiaceae bacterium]